MIADRAPGIAGGAVPSERWGAEVLDVVAFDLDDTLWLETSAQLYALEELRRAWGVEAPLAAFRSVWREASSRLFDAYLGGHLTHAEQRRRRVRELLRALDQPYGEDAVERWTLRYTELYEERWEPLPDAGPTLDRLGAMGLGLAVVTNGDGDQQRRKLVRMGLLPRLDWVLISGEVGAAKPDPAIFERLLAQSGAPPERVLFVGDRPDKDVLPAREMGMAALQIDHSRRAGGPLVVHDLTEVAVRVEGGGRLS